MGTLFKITNSFWWKLFWMCWSFYFAFDAAKHGNVFDTAFFGFFALVWAVIL